jgi:hypothetical protein
MGDNADDVNGNGAMGYDNDDGDGATGDDGDGATGDNVDDVDDDLGLGARPPPPSSLPTPRPVGGWRWDCYDDGRWRSWSWLWR